MSWDDSKREPVAEDSAAREAAIDHLYMIGFFDEPPRKPSPRDRCACADSPKACAECWCLIRELWCCDLLDNDEACKALNSDSTAVLSTADLRRLFRLDAPVPKKPAPPPLRSPSRPGGNPAYVRAAIAKELAELAVAPRGRRNATLNTVAFKVFGFVKGGHADEAATRAELERIALAIGLEQREIAGARGDGGTLGSAWNAATPREVPAPGVAFTVTEVDRAALAPQGAK